MRITYIHQYFATTESAGGVRSFVFSKHLTARGHNVTVITSDAFLPDKLKRRKRFTVSGINVINIQTAYTLKLNFIQRVLSFIKFMFLSTYYGLNVPADIVFATSTPLTVAFPALIIKFFMRVPFIFEVRDLWPDVPIELGIINNRALIFLVKTFEKTTYALSERIICISEGIRNKIKVPHVKKFYIPTGCDLHLFNGKKNTSWKEEMGITSARLFVLTGAIGKANAPTYLLDAAKIIKEKGGDGIAIAMVGDGSAKQDIVQMRHDYSLDNVFLFDPVAKKDLPRILAAADAGIILHGVSRTYRETAMPNKFFDYIAAGLPVIFNFEGPLKDLLLEKKAGYYVDHRSPEQLGHTLLRISRNREEAITFGRNARRLAEHTMNQTKQADRFERALHV